MTQVEAVRVERASRGWPVTQAAAEGGISQAVWDRYEAGNTALTIDVQEGIAQAFGWDVNWPDQHDPAHPASAPLRANERGGTSEAAVGVLIVCLVLGILAGWVIGATRNTIGGTQWAVMTEQPLDDADKVFNWLLFSLFVCTGIIASAVVWAGGQLRRR